METLIRASVAALLVLQAGTLALAAQSPPAGSPSAPGPKGEQSFHFTDLNHSYHDVLPPLAPIAQGPLTIQLRSPHQTLDLLDNTVLARPNGDGTHDLTIDVDFAGRGELTADMTLGAMTHRYDDQVELPRQTKRMLATVRIHPIAGGYEITMVHLPDQVTVAIRSNIGDRIISWCDRMAMIPFFALDCDGLTQSLETAVVPLPPPGSTYLLTSDQLSPEQRAQIDAYLAASGDETRKTGEKGGP
ncbi:MAG TPA: hypothetical protein VKA53_05455 [Thermoanaerobaculia bacterium]|nr:hypothetical protein [Thermoanaerobaculia bacterium]